MVDVYRARFHLGDEHRRPAFKEVVSFINRAATQATGIDIELSENARGDFNQEGRLVRNAHCTEDGKNLYGLRWTKPEHGVNWSVDIGLRDKKSEDPLVEITLEREAIGDKVTISREKIRRPAVVQGLISRFGAHAFDKLSTKPFRIKRDKVEELARFLKNPKRDLPVVLMSRDNFSEIIVADARAIASQLAGISYVFATEDRKVSRRLGEFDPTLSCYNGAVRLYWPMDIGEEIYNPLWTQERQMETRNLPAQLFRLIAERSIVRGHLFGLGEVEKLVSDNERKELVERINQTRTFEDYERLVESYEGDLQRCKKKEEETQTTIQDLRGLLHASDLEKQALRASMIELQKQKSTRSIETSEKDVELTPVNSMQQAYDAYLENYEEQARNIIMHPRAERHIKKSQFQHLENFLSLLDWINSTLVPSRRGEISVPDLNASCLRATGMTYAPNQSNVTMGQWERDYKVNFEGKNLWLEEHFRMGSNANEEQSLSVAGVTLPDSHDRKFLLGFVGYHQRNR